VPSGGRPRRVGVGAWVPIERPGPVRGRGAAGVVEQLHLEGGVRRAGLPRPLRVDPSGPDAEPAVARRAARRRRGESVLDPQGEIAELPAGVTEEAESLAEANDPPVLDGTHRTDRRIPGRARRDPTLPVPGGRAKR